MLSRLRPCAGHPTMETRRRIGFLLEIVVFWVLWSMCETLAADIVGGRTPGPLHGFEHLKHFAVAVPLVTAVIALLLRARGEGLADLGLRRPATGWARAVGLGMLAALLIAALEAPLTHALDALGLEWSGAAFDLDEPGSLAAYIVSGALAGGFGEELVYRGYLLSRFERAFTSAEHPRRGTALAVAATSLWFGLEHRYQGWLGVVAVGIYGLVFAGVYLAARRNLVPAMVAHASTDAIALLQLSSAAG